MSANSKPCPDCSAGMMDRGGLSAWNKGTSKYDSPVNIMDDGESFGINALYCKECGHVELVLM